MRLWGATSLWHTNVARCVSICVSVYPFTVIKNASSRICLNRFSWYLDTMIIRWGDNRGVREFGVKGHLGVIWGHCSNMLKMLLRLHNSIDFDETWRKWSLARGSFGMFRNIWSEIFLESFGVTVDHWVFNLLKGVLHLWALFLKTLCIFSKNKATSDKVSYGSGQKCSKELENYSFTSVETIVVKLQWKMCENQYFPCFEP